MQPYVSTERRHEDVCGLEVYLHALFTLALDEG
jgi:hypothetical protein